LRIFDFIIVKNINFIILDITLIKKTATEGFIKIKLFPGDYQPKVDEKVKEYARKANIKGFRRGKVPSGVIKKLYGKSIKAEEINHILSHSLSDYIKENKIQLLGNPIPETDKTQKINWDTQTEFEFEFAIGMVDDFKYDLSSKVKVKKHIINLDDKVLRSNIEDIRMRYGKMINPDIAAVDDSIYGNFKLSGTDRENDAVLDLNRINKNNLKNFTGLKKNDILSFDLRNVIKDNEMVASLFATTIEDAKNISGEVILTVKNINRVEPADLNKDLFDKVFGKDQVKSEKEFKDKVKTTVQENYNKESEYLLIRDIKDTLIGKTKIETPDAFLKRWLQYSNENKISAEDIEKDYELYLKDLKWNLVGNRIFNDFKIKVENEEVTKTARKQIINQLGGTSVADVYKEQLNGIVQNFLQAENGKNYSTIYNKVKEEKIIKVIRENISISEKKVDLEAFKKLANE